MNATVLMLIAGAVLGGAIMAMQTLFAGLAPQCYAREVGGTGVGLAVAIGKVGAICGPLIVGALLASGRTASDVLYATLPIIGICGLATIGLILRRHGAKTAGRYR